jgi:hypothetical protein
MQRAVITQGDKCWHQVLVEAAEAALRSHSQSGVISKMKRQMFPQRSIRYDRSLEMGAQTLRF